MIRFFKYLFFIILKRDKCLIVQLSIATHLSTNSLFVWNQFSFLDEQMNRCVFRYKSMDETGKNQDKWVNETSVSSISTDWSMQSISIKSNLPIFIDLSIDKWILIFTDWLLWAISKNESKYLCDIKIWINDHFLSLPCQMEKMFSSREHVLSD